ncbi:MAG: hypothetical protein ACQESR_25280 [Planctomycetota bacterium]
MNTKETVDRLFEDVDRQTGKPFTYPVDIQDAVTILTGLGYWATPQALQYATVRGVVRLPLQYSPVSQMALTEEQVKALAYFLEEHRQWNPLGAQHDHKMSREELDAARNLRKQLLEIKGLAETLSPTEILDLLVDETNAHNRWALWLTVREILSRFETHFAKEQEVSRG